MKKIVLIISSLCMMISAFSQNPISVERRQSSYKGSVEQQEDVATLDKMIDEGY